MSASSAASGAFKLRTGWHEAFTTRVSSMADLDHEEPADGNPLEVSFLRLLPMKSCVSRVVGATLQLQLELACLP